MHDHEPRISLDRQPTFDDILAAAKKARKQYVDPKKDGADTEFGAAEIAYVRARVNSDLGIARTSLSHARAAYKKEVAAYLIHAAYGEKTPRKEEKSAMGHTADIILEVVDGAIARKLLIKGR